MEPHFFLYDYIAFYCILDLILFCKNIVEFECRITRYYMYFYLSLRLLILLTSHRYRLVVETSGSCFSNRRIGLKRHSRSCSRNSSKSSSRDFSSVTRLAVFQMLPSSTAAGVDSVSVSTGSSSDSLAFSCFTSLGDSADDCIAGVGGTFSSSFVSGGV